MKFVKESYIHNRLIFEECEKDTLQSAVNIISMVRNNNIHSCDAEDEYLTKKCEEIIKGISELLDNYSNEYLDDAIINI